jgi:hypothetical protein
VNKRSMRSEKGTGRERPARGNESSEPALMTALDRGGKALTEGDHVKVHRHVEI